MRLSTMWKVDATVDASGHSPIAERILASWAHDAGSMRHFRSSANFLYTFRHQGKDYFLRFADSSERSREAIAAEIAFVRWLDGEGIDVALPVLSRHSNFVETIETEVGIFHAVVFNALQGSQFEIDDLDEAHFRKWGAALGELHSVVMRYPGNQPWSSLAWRDHLEFARDQIPNDGLVVRNELDRLAASLSALPADSDTYGLIHFDYELDNLVWDGDAVKILDFDDCSFNWFVADVASALRDLFEDGVDLDHSSFQAFVEGYRTHAMLDETSIRQIPLFLRMVELLNYAKSAHALDLSHNEKYPDWLKGLRLKLEKRMAAYSDSLDKRTV